MAGYWPSSFLCLTFYGPGRRKKGIRLISSHLDLTSFVNKRLIKFQKNNRLITNHDLLISRDRKESQLFVAQ